MIYVYIYIQEFAIHLGDSQPTGERDNILGGKNYYGHLLLSNDASGYWLTVFYELNGTNAWNRRTLTLTHEHQENGCEHSEQQNAYMVTKVTQQLLLFAILIESPGEQNPSRIYFSFMCCIFNSIKFN